MALLAYSNSFASALVLDAKVLLAIDERIRALTFGNLRLIFTTNYWWSIIPDWIFRPVTTLSYLFNYAVLGNGTATTGYHVVNFLLHAGNVWLVHALARRVLRDPRAAFLAAAIWAVHPIGVEAVTNIPGRPDLLAAMFVLAGLLIYATLADLRGWRIDVSVAALFAVSTAGVFSKESAVSLIGLMLLWDLCRFTPHPPRGRRAAAYAAVAASLVVLWRVRHAVLAYLPLPESAYVDNPMRGVGFLVARSTALKVIARDLGLLLWPAGLSSDHSYRDIVPQGLSDPATCLAVAIVAALLFAAVLRYRRDRVMFFAAGFFAVALLPTSNLIALPGAIMADRFLYLPSVAFAVALVALADRLASPKIVTLVLAAVIALYGTRTFVRNFAWRDELALATADLRVAPASFRLHNMMATALLEKDPRRNLDRAISEEERSWAIVEPLPARWTVQAIPAALGHDYQMKGDASGGPLSPAGRLWYQKAAAILLRARDLSQAYERAFDQTQRAAGILLGRRLLSPDLYLDLGATMMGLGRYSEAWDAYRYAHGFNPNLSDPYDGMALAAQEMGRPEDAVIVAEEKGLMDDFPPSTLNEIFKLYKLLPQGSCAVVVQNGDPRLNLRCPVVARDICRAVSSLAAAHRSARRVADAVRWEGPVARRYGCPASP